MLRMTLFNKSSPSLRIDQVCMKCGWASDSTIDKVCPGRDCGSDEFRPITEKEKQDGVVFLCYGLDPINGGRIEVKGNIFI